MQSMIQILSEEVTQMANPQICIRFDPETMKRLQQLAHEEGDKNVASLVRRITNRYLNEKMQCRQIITQSNDKWNAFIQYRS